MREVVCSDELEGCVLEPPNPNKVVNPKDSEDKPIKFNYPLVGSGGIGNSSSGLNQLLPLKGFKSVVKAIQKSQSKKKVVGKGAKRRKSQPSHSSELYPFTPPSKPKKRSKTKAKSPAKKLKKKKSTAKKAKPKKKTAKAKAKKKKPTTTKRK